MCWAECLSTSISQHRTGLLKNEYLFGLGLGEVDAAIGAAGGVALGVGPARKAELLCELLLHAGPLCDCFQLLQLLQHTGKVVISSVFLQQDTI